MIHMKRSRLSRKGSKARKSRMKKSVTFTSEIVKERSWSPKAERLGRHESTMTLMKAQDGNYVIEWVVPDLDEVVEIGIVAKGKKVMDYDGVFELPSEAVKLLKQNGFDVSEVVA